MSNNAVSSVPWIEGRVEREGQRAGPADGKAMNLCRFPAEKRDLSVRTRGERVSTASVETSPLTPLTPLSLSWHGAMVASLRG